MTTTLTAVRYGNTYRPLVRFGAAVAFLVSFSLVAESLPNCTGACVTGFNKCTAWCEKHNKTTKSYMECFSNCIDYWHSGTNPQSIGRGDPRQSYVPGKMPIVPLGQ